MNADLTGTYSPQRKTASEPSQDLRDRYPMRLAQVGLGSGVGLPGLSVSKSNSWSGPRPNYSLTRNARQPPLPRTPGEAIYMNPSNKKTPLQQPTKEKREQKLLQTSAPASALSLQLTLSTCLLQQRAGLKGYFANSPPYIATGPPCVNGFNLSRIRYFVRKHAPSAGERRACRVSL